MIPPAGATAGMSTFLGQGVSYVYTGSRNPYVHQFSFGIQRELPGSISAEASYVGSRTRSAWSATPSTPSLWRISRWAILPRPAIQLPERAGAESFRRAAAGHEHQRPYGRGKPTVAAISGIHYGVTVTDTNVGKIWYNSLQVAVQKRYAHGLTFSANYTFSKNIQATSYVNPQDATPTRVLTAFDRPQRLAFSPSYELPFGPGRRFLNSTNGIARRFVGGWQVLVNTVFQSYG